MKDSRRYRQRHRQPGADIGRSQSMSRRTRSSAKRGRSRGPGMTSWVAGCAARQDAPRCLRADARLCENACEIVREAVPRNRRKHGAQKYGDQEAPVGGMCTSCRCVHYRHRTAAHKYAGMVDYSVSRAGDAEPPATLRAKHDDDHAQALFLSPAIMRTTFFSSVTHGLGRAVTSLARSCAWDSSGV